MTRVNEDAVDAAFGMLEEPIIKVMREHGLPPTLAALCNHTAMMLHKMGSAGKVDVDAALRTLGQVARTGQGCVAFGELSTQ